MPVAAEENVQVEAMEIPQEQEKERISKPMVGFIYPPPEVRNIVDKTAHFVARNGPDFEARIRQNEIGNAKFNFLNPTDPYHAYYQHKVQEVKDSDGPSESTIAVQQSIVKSLLPDLTLAPAAELSAPKEPPPEFEYVIDPPSISGLDLDVVKLTAHFVARNGRQFLTSLMNREQKNYLFDFLRPQHSLFTYFTRLVEQYTKILIPQRDMLEKLQREADNPNEILSVVKYRVAWARQIELKQRKEAEAIEKERVSYAQIDWHDFVVVETVDYQPDESGNFPPPTTAGEVGARLLAQERIEKEPPPPPPPAPEESHDSGGEENEAEMEMELSDDEEEVEPPVEEKEKPEEEEDEEEEETAPGTSAEDNAPMRPPLPPQPPLPPAPDQVIVKDYDPKAPRVQSAPTIPDEYLISPLTQEKIPAHKLQEHMKYGLLDRKWLEQKNRTTQERREQEEVYAPGTSIDSHLKSMAARRTDIFGSGSEETSIGRKIGEQESEARPNEQSTWDGHSTSSEKTKEVRKITIEEQLKAINETRPDTDADRIGPSTKVSRPPPPQMLPRPPPPQQQQQQPRHPPPPPPRPVQPPPMQPGMRMGGGILRTPMGPGQSLMGMPPGPPQRMMPMPPRAPMASVPMRPILAMPVGQVPMAFAAQAASAIRNMAPVRPGGMGLLQPGGVPPPPPMGMPGGGGDEPPPAKKAKTEDHLINEHHWLSQHSGPVSLKVAIPNMPGKTEWNLTGQLLAFMLPPTDQVSVIKAKINEVLGMPAGKQKLQYDGMFIKDSNTIAFYNMVHGGVVHLALKERGGRKK